MQAATLREDCRPEIASFSETSEEGILEQPIRDRNGEGSHDRGMSHQKNSVSQRGRGRGMHVNSMPKQRREGEANRPPGQRPPRVSRTGPSWTEFVRPAHQAVVAFAGAGMINRAEPRACGYSREPIHLDSEPDTERNAGFASNAAGDGWGRARSDQAGRQPYRGKLAVRNGKRGWGKRGQDLMPICHAPERAGTSEAIGLNRSRLHSTRPVRFFQVRPEIYS